jgi:hypothetical protein
MKKLTAAKIAALTAPGRFATGGNLYIRLRDSGSKTWTFYYRFQGEMHDLGLGDPAKRSLPAIEKRPSCTFR